MIMARCGCPNCDNQSIGTCVLGITPKDGGCEKGNNSAADYEYARIMEKKYHPPKEVWDITQENVTRPTTPQQLLHAPKYLVGSTEYLNGWMES